MANKKITGLTEATSLDGTEWAEVVQGGVNKKTRTSNMGTGGSTTNQFRGAWDLSGDLPPTGTGSGAAGANVAGDMWYASVGGTVDIGSGDEFWPVNTVIIAKIDGAVNPEDFLWQG